MDKKFCSEYPIGYYDIDINGKINVINLLENMQEVSSLQSETLGVGLEYMSKLGMGWILMAAKAKFITIPKYGEQLKYYTWSNGKDGLYTHRQFEIRNSNNETIIACTTKWIQYSLERKRPVRISDELIEKYNCIPDTVISNEILKIEDVGEKVLSYTKSVKYIDVDTNNHMNNTKYLKYAIEAMGFDFLNTHQIQEYRVEYIHEAKYNDEIEINVYKVNEKEYKYDVKNLTTDKMSCKFYITWNIED